MRKQPNILFVMTDDQGAWAMNCSGTPELYTPNLDRIAERGVRFEDFYCASPVCSPARATLLTGSMPSAHGVLDWIRSGNVDKNRFESQGKENPYAEGYGMECKPISYLEGQTAYTDLLAAAGYQCALSGKWHLGDSVRPQHGFSKWFTLGLGGCCYYHPDLVENGTIKVEHESYVTERFTDKALDYLDEFAHSDRPFYLSVHYTAPHAPWGREHHPARWIDYYENSTFESIPDIPDHPDLVTGPVYGTEKRKENLRGYFAAISAMDEQVGRLLDGLEEKGLNENTIVIFTSDNGMSMGQHGIWGKGNGTFPMNMYDSAVKVPFLISWPGVLPTGKVCRHLVSAYDLFPTLLELAGVNEHVEQVIADAAEAGQQADKRYRKERLLPGKSFLSLIMDTKSSKSSSAISLENRPEEGVVIFDEYGPVRMIRNREWKYIHRFPYGKHELYHISEDKEECENLYDDPDYEEIIIALRKQMEKWFIRYTDPEVDGLREEVTGGGQLCRPGIHAIRKDIFAPYDS